MTSIDEKRITIIALEKRIEGIHNQMDELEEVSNLLSSKIIMAKRQLELLLSQQGELI